MIKAESWVIIPNEVLEDKELKFNDKMVYSGLDWFKNEDKIVNTKLSKLTGVNNALIPACLKRLEDKGYIEQVEGSIKPYKDFKKVRGQGNYTRIPLPILEHKDLNSRDKVLYLILYKLQGNKDKFVNPKREYLGECIGRSKRTITDIIAKLKRTSIQGTALITVLESIQGLGDLVTQQNRYKVNIITPNSREEGVNRTNYSKEIKEVMKKVEVDKELTAREIVLLFKELVNETTQVNNSNINIAQNLFINNGVETKLIVSILKKYSDRYDFHFKDIKYPKPTLFGLKQDFIINQVVHWVQEDLRLEEKKKEKERLKNDPRHQTVDKVY
ncbi:hypothetical protein U472_03265 [Orenia metallireducens]|uniref:Helix-turn-helix domain-containing protein n=1 Tax=Orenia metallireducens TaxID=1413210 RepID=A0A1C0AB38_9FIRM|nr:hypothetical protein [Orenia metallireducens]OCL27587.1 hypothetical protein U472_03265 [Orenia metallireducens]